MTLADPAKVGYWKKETMFICTVAGGSSSFVAASYPEKQGVYNLHVISGGWRKIKEKSKAEIGKEKEPMYWINTHLPVDIIF